jgi:DNA-binding NtrC family response regulator
MMPQNPACAADSNRLPISSRTDFGGLVATSAAMRTVFGRLEKAAASDATVLLLGETGVGKSQAALALHRESARRAGPFVIVDCGAIPANLLESELFGHERGAFTGADSRRIGAFEEAHGGTLFLDEIGELPRDLQPKLLGVLESRSIRRVGASGTRAVDVRLVAATNRDLRQEINDGRFRADLFFRLAVIQVSLPSLRERPEDIPTLAEKVLRSLGADSARIERLMQPAFVAQLSASAWPGNVRELRNYLERCLVFDETPSPGGEPEPGTVATGQPMLADAALPYTEARDRALGQFERAYLNALLGRHGGKVVEAAEAAAIDRTYFYRLLRRNGMVP